MMVNHFFMYFSPFVRFICRSYGVTGRLFYCVNGITFFL